MKTQQLCAVLILAPLWLNAQSWIPDDVYQQTILVERYTFQDSEEVLLDFDDNYEEERDDFLEGYNELASLTASNVQLDSLFKSYNYPHITVVPSKLKTNYPDKDQYRYVLKQELFFGKKRMWNAETKKTEDKSYFAHRYYFHDRVTEEDLPAYYFSAAQSAQTKRVIYWLNKKAAQQELATSDLSSLEETSEE